MRRIFGGLLLVSFVVACTAVASSPPGTSRSGLPRSDNAPHRPTQRSAVDTNNPVTPGFWPVSVAFWSREHGLLAGRIFECDGCSRSLGAVAITRDGGLTWRLAYRGTAQVSDLTVGSAGRAWATAGTRHPRIIASRDGGDSWRVLGGSEGLAAAVFTATGHGWAVSGFGAHLVRWDGTAWARSKDPCSRGEIVDISFPWESGGIGWLACSWGAGAGQELKGIFETRDGGSSWAPRTVVRPDEPRLSIGGGLGGYGYLEAVSFLSDGAGWLVESRGTFLSTPDGGATWQSNRGFQEPEIDFGADAWRVDDRLGFALIDRRGMVLHFSTDGGSTWDRIASFRSP